MNLDDLQLTNRKVLSTFPIFDYTANRQQKVAINQLPCATERRRKEWISRVKDIVVHDGSIVRYELGETGIPIVVAENAQGNLIMPVEKQFSIGAPRRTISVDALATSDYANLHNMRFTHDMSVPELFVSNDLNPMQCDGIEYTIESGDTAYFLHGLNEKNRQTTMISINADRTVHSVSGDVDGAYFEIEEGSKITIYFVPSKTKPTKISELYKTTFRNGEIATIECDNITMRTDEAHETPFAGSELYQAVCTALKDWKGSDTMLKSLRTFRTEAEIRDVMRLALKGEEKSFLAEYGLKPADRVDEMRFLQDFARRFKGESDAPLRLYTARH